MALFSGKLAYRQQTNKPASSKDTKSKLGYVYDVILDNDAISDITIEIDDTEFKNVSLVGAIRFRYGMDTISSESELSIAFPFDKNFVNLPLKNETVEIYTGNGSQFFYRRIGRDVTPNFNSSENLITDSFIKSNSTNNTSADYKKVQTTGITKTNNDTSNKYDGYGDYFTTDNTIHKLKLYEGDSLIQSRFGQSVRFSGFNNDNQQQSPTIIIRNDESSFSKKKNIDEVVEEDINRDGSVIVLGSNQYQLPFQPGTVDDGGTSDFETKPTEFKSYPSKLIGDQILINSGRLIFSAKTAEMIFYSKKNYGFISDGGLSINNRLGIDVNVGDIINITTNDRDINLNTNNGKINIGNKDLEPLVKGDTLVEILSELIDAINKMQFLTPSGPSAIGPVNLPDFNKIKSKLNTALSDLNKTS
jgi:predicted small secreted protein